MRNYHIVLNDGTERNVKASELQIEINGALWFINDAGERFMVYGPATWQLVEVESRDDRGTDTAAPDNGGKKGGRK